MQRTDFPRIDTKHATHLPLVFNPGCLELVGFGEPKKRQEVRE